MDRMEVCGWRFVGSAEAKAKRTDTGPHSRDTLLVRASPFRSRLLREEGAGKDRVRAAPAVSCALMHKEKRAHEHTGEAEASGLPCAMALRLIRALPGDQAFLSPSSLRSFRFFRSLTP